MGEAKEPSPLQGGGLGEGTERSAASVGAESATLPLSSALSPEGERELKDTLTTATAQLTAISDTPRLDAELLMAHALGVEREALLLDPARYAAPANFATLLTRRLAHEPIAYILGYRDFWTIRLAVGPGVLIPRTDSETLIEALVEHCLDRSSPLRILDLGTGPGTLLLAALSEFRQAHGLGIDSSDVALGYARSNMQGLGLGNRATFRLGNWASGVDGAFDVIMCNPPYVESAAALDAQVAEFEPGGALFAGPDGLDDYRRILPTLPDLLAPDGVAIVEIGAAQRADVAALAEAAGMRVTCKPDLGGRDRALICRLA